MMRRFSSILTTGVLMAAAACTPANASLLWNWDYSAPGISAAGTFLTEDTPDAQGGFLITSIGGERDGVAITALQPTGTSIPGNEPFTVDNEVFAGPGPQLSGDGFGFALADGTFVNTFYASFLQPAGYLEFFSMPATGSTTELPVTFSASLVATPEPGTAVLLSLAFAMCGIDVRLHRA